MTWTQWQLWSTARPGWQAWRSPTSSFASMSPSWGAGGQLDNLFYLSHIPRCSTYCCGYLSSLSCTQNTKQTHISQIPVQPFLSIVVCNCSYRCTHLTTPRGSSLDRDLDGFPLDQMEVNQRGFHHHTDLVLTRLITSIIAFGFQSFLTLQAATASWYPHLCITLPNGT